MYAISLKELAQKMGGELSFDPGVRWVQRLHTDSRSLEEGDCFVAIRGERFDGHDYVAGLPSSPALAAVVRLDYPPSQVPDFPLIRVADPLIALQQFSAHYRQSLSARVVGVTGSSGKTSTKEMISSVLQQRYRTLATRGNLNNHLGVPLTLLELKGETEYAVAEMGMNHRGEISVLASMVLPDIAVITNIGTAHIEYLGSPEEIALEKTDLLTVLKPNGVAVLSADDYWSVHYADRTSARIIWTGLTEKAQVRAEDIAISSMGITFRLITEKGKIPVRLPLFNRVMIKNALLAAGVGLAAGLTLEEISAGLEAVKLVGSRMEIKSWRGGWIINDSYNANPDSTKASLQALREFPGGSRRVAFLGSMAELGVHAETLHQEIGAAAVAEKVDVLVAVGTHSQSITEGARQAGWNGVILQAADSPEQGFKILREILLDQDVVLVKGSRFWKLERVVQALSEEKETLS